MFWINPSHKLRVVVAYNICSGKPTKYEPQFQEITIYCQLKNIKTSPMELFWHDFVRQCVKWRKEGVRLIGIMDANKHTVDGQLCIILEAEGVNLIEFSHKH